MKTLFSRFDKAQIPPLPVVEFGGKIVVVQSEDDARRAVDFLLTQPIVGFDTETKPTFQRGEHHDVCLVQVGTADLCFLFRLSMIGIPQCLITLFESEQVCKVGLSLKDDLLRLRRRGCDFKPGNFFELQSYVAELGIEDKGLQKIFANVFGQRISKSQQLSNWEGDVLSDRQKAYAATDAWACLMLYHELRRLQADGFHLEIVPEPEPPVTAPVAEQKPAEKNEMKKTKRKKAASKKRRSPKKKTSSPQTKTPQIETPQ